MADMEEMEAVAEPQSEELQQVLSTIKKWFEQDREAKMFYVREMDENDKLYEGNHWDLIGPDGNPLRSRKQQAMRPNAVENVAFSLVAGAVSEFSDPIEIVDFPVEPGDDEVARLMTDLKQYILDKNDHDQQRMDWNWNFFWHGTGIWEVTWDPTWKGGRGPNRWVGEVRLISRHPRTVFPDARCGNNIQNGRYGMRGHAEQILRYETILARVARTLSLSKHTRDRAPLTADGCGAMRANDDNDSLSPWPSWSCLRFWPCPPACGLRQRWRRLHAGRLIRQ